MKLKILKINSLTLLATIISSMVCTGLNAQIVTNDRLLSFEKSEIPSYIKAKGGELSVSDAHYKDGLKSMLWKFSPNSELTITRDLCFEPRPPKSRDLYISCFVVWLYNEQPQDKIVRFEFLKEGKLCTSFPMNINFSGWRAAWVSYERDMEGEPQQGMDQIRITAPDVAGTLYLDHLVTAIKCDPRHQTADIQLPFVNAQTDNHWLVLLAMSKIKPTGTLQSSVTEQQIAQMETIEKRLNEVIFVPATLTEKAMQNIRNAYATYNIRYRDGKVSGLPIFFARAREAYERMTPAIENWQTLIESKGMEVKDYFDLMHKIAVAYNNAKEPTSKDELSNMFLSMYDHITDQGIAYGSCWGNFTHYGYSFRGLYTSYFLMKDLLRKAGKLDEAVRTLQWYAMTNEVFSPLTSTGMDMDAFNTVATGRVASIMIMENTPLKVQYLNAFSNWVDNGCRPANGLAGAFKTDGGAFHHRNNYPAYAVGGLEGATNMIYLLNNTDFAVSELGHQTVKNVLLTMRFYCNKRHFPLSMSGRHPDGKGKLIPIQFAVMAISGTPDRSSQIDSQMAAAYLRLVSTDTPKSDPEYMPYVTSSREKQTKQMLTAKGFRAENDPQGNIAIGYGAVSVQRRDNWSAVVRGHSRYLWAAEHYAQNNFYGRYLAHGSMQILTAPVGMEVTPTTSLWQEEGFDWGRIPGTTAIHLPVEQLRARVYNVDKFSGNEEMLYSDQTFAGGISQQGHNGAFAMILHEHDKYNGSHRARKSFHMFDGRIVCLGSDIENTNNDYNTETTIFQVAATDSNAVNYWNAYTPLHNTWIDNAATGYYVPAKNLTNVRFEKNFPQHSLGQKTALPTVGNWVSLVADHGKAPHGASYEYVVIPQTTQRAMTEFATRPSYTVLQCDSSAHIVQDQLSGTTSYALFEKADQLPKGLVQAVDTAALVMVLQNSLKTVLTVANPDLALYRGASDERLDSDGKRTERSIYSRPWIDNKSLEIPVRVTLAGRWKIEQTPKCSLISNSHGTTVLEFHCTDGASIDVTLTKVN